MKHYPAIKNIYEKCFKTSDNGPNVMLTNRIQNCIYSMIPNYDKVSSDTQWKNILSDEKYWLLLGSGIKDAYILLLVFSTKNIYYSTTSINKGNFFPLIKLH